MNCLFKRDLCNRGRMIPWFNILIILGGTTFFHAEILFFILLASKFGGTSFSGKKSGNSEGVSGESTSSEINTEIWTSPS